MTPHETTIASLINLALNDAASQEEARTAAMAALRMAQKHGATINVSARRVSAHSDAPPPPASQPAPQAAQAPPSGSQKSAAPSGQRKTRGGFRRDWKVFASKYDTACDSCDAPIAQGADFAWKPGQAVCCACHKAESSAA